jgi:hypothetical protein
MPNQDGFRSISTDIGRLAVLHPAQVCSVSHFFFDFYSLPRRASTFKFQQDGASVHKSKSTNKWIKNHKIRLFNNGRWPPTSPDMNIIEHVWPLVGRKLIGRTFSGRESLWEGLKQAFGEVTPREIENLYSSLPSRIRALYLAKGRSTRY